MVSKKYYYDIDLGGNRLLNFATESVSGELPSEAKEGAMIYHSGEGVMYQRLKDGWKVIASGKDLEDALSKVSEDLQALSKDTGEALDTKADKTTVASLRTEFDEEVRIRAEEDTNIKADFDTKADKTTVSSLSNTLTKEIQDRQSGDSINATALSSHATNTSNPHGVTKEQVGLGNVDDTSDIDKPISTAVQTALNGKAGTSVATTSANGLMSSGDKTKLEGISSGAQANVIETVKVNGTALTPSSKAVNIDLSDYAKKSDVSTVMRYKGSVSTVTKLPTTATLGDTYNVIDTNANYTWDGSAWDLIGSTVDLSAYATTSAMNTALAGKQATLTAGENITISGATISAKDTTYGIATTEANGLMSASDKEKLDTIATGANKTTVESSLSSTSTNPVQNKVIKSVLDNKATLKAPNDLLHNTNEFTFIPGGHSGELYINYRTASGSTDGNISNYHFCGGNGQEVTVMANYFKGKFQGSSDRPEYNGSEVALLSDVPTVDSSLSSASTNPVQNKVINSALAGKQATLTAGSNITISGTTISAKDTTYGVATQSANGLLSSTDKKKLDEIASGAQVNSITGVKGNAESAYRTGNVNITPANIGLGNVNNTSDANKPISTAVQAALDGKLSTSGTAAKATADASGNNIVNTYAKKTEIPDVSGFETKANAIVKLEASGRTITYTKGDNTTGTITTQDNNTDTKVKQTNSTANTAYPILLKNGTGTGEVTNTVLFDDGVTVNPSTGVITAPGFAGPLTGNVTGNCSGSSGSCTGNAATATQFSANKSVALTGDVTGSASSKAGWSVATTLAASGVTAGNYGPSADASPAHKGTFSVPYITVDAKGRVTAASTKTITLPADNNTTYSNMTAATADAAGKAGLVPAPAAGAQGKFLRGDGTWQTPSNTKNTAGSTDSSSKLFLIGATSQAASPQTYSHDTAYVGTDGKLYSGGKVVIASGDKATSAGSADSATKATQDSAGQQINTTYIKALSVSGRTITYTKGDNTTGTITTQDSNTTYSAGTGLSLSGTTFNHSNSITANTSGVGSATEVPIIKYDAQGHITSVTTATIYPPTSAGSAGQVWVSDGSGAGAWQTLENGGGATRTSITSFSQLITALGSSKIGDVLVGESISSSSSSYPKLSNFAFTLVGDGTTMGGIFIGVGKIFTASTSSTDYYGGASITSFGGLQLSGTNGFSIGASSVGYIRGVTLVNY